MWTTSKSGPTASIIFSNSQKENQQLFAFEQVLELYKRAHLILIMHRTGLARQLEYFFPGKLQESCLTGVPVLATPTGNIQQTYSPVLYVLEKETSENLAEMISKIKDTPYEFNQKLGIMARTFVIREKHWRVQSRRIIEYLNSIFTLNSGFSMQ